MTERRFLVFVVDDEPMMLELAESALADDCAVESFPSAEACLKRLTEQTPDMFLLDVRLPGMDGYAFCRILKSDPAMADIPVTFVSGFDTIDARLAGYEAGGEDFIVKPFELSELRRKVQVAQRIRIEKKQLREMAGYAQRTAFSAMTSMGELGTVLDFLRKSFACADGPALAQAILDALAQYGLQGAVQVRLNGESHSQSAEGKDLPLETAILNHARLQGRLFEFKNRSVYNYGGVTVLVKNMPLDDPERCGRIRDNLAILAEGADARRQAVEIERANHRTRAGIDVVLAEVQAALASLRASHQREQFRATQIMVEVQEALANTFIGLGLSEQQENAMMSLVRGYFEQLRDDLASGFDIDDELEKLSRALQALVAG